MGHVLGIALGGTNACVAVLGDHGVEVVPNADGNRTTPAMVAFLDSGEHLVGELAKRQATVNPGSTVTGLRRLIGRRFADEETRRYAQSCSFGVVPSASGDAWLAVRGKRSPPEQVTALLLDRVRQAASGHLGTPVREAVISVPVWFDHSQRGALRRAARLAGLDVVSLIDEPLAATFAHDAARRRPGERSRLVAVYDLGGSSFNVTILERRGEVLAVAATASDPFLGGRDLDERIVDHLAETFRAQTGVDLRADPLALQRLREAAESVKHELSVALTSAVNLPFIAVVEGAPRHLTAQVTRHDFERLVGDLVERTLAPCRAVLAEAGVTVRQIDELILVGGQTRTPRVREVVATFFRRAPAARVNPDEAVALGAAIDGARLRGGAAAAAAGLTEADLAPEEATTAAAAAPDPTAFEPPDDSLLPAGALVELAPVPPPQRGAAPGSGIELDEGPSHREGWPHTTSAPGTPWPSALGYGTTTGVWVPPPPPRPAPRPPRRGFLYLLLGATAVVAVSLPALALLRRHQRTAAIALVTPASASTPVPQTIPILLDVRPVRAVVTLDGVDLGTQRLAVPRDGRRHTLRFSAPGYVSQTVTFDAEEMQLIRVELVRVQDDPLGREPLP